MCKPLEMGPGILSGRAWWIRLARRAGLIALALVAAVTGSIATADSAHACSCEGTPLSEYSEEVTVAFVGRQISRVVHDETSKTGATLTFEVDEVFKGEVPETLELVTHPSGPTCGVDFSDGFPVAINAYERNGKLTAYQCGNRFRVEDLKEVFGASHAPIPTTSTTPSAPPTTRPVATTQDAAELATENQQPRAGSESNSVLVLLLAVAGIAALTITGLAARRRPQG